MKKITNILENIIIMLYIVVCSYQRIFIPINQHFDEILLIILLLFELIKDNPQKTIKKNSSYILFIIFLVFTLLNIIIKQYEVRAYIIELFNYLKVYILLFTLRRINMDEKKFKLLMSFFVIVNIISIIIGISTYNNFGLANNMIGNKFRNGKLRIAGLSGHPIELGLLCTFLISFIIEEKSKKNVSLIITIIIITLSTYAMILTQSRLAILIMIMYFIIKIILFIVNKSNKRRQIFIAIMSLIISIVLLGITIFSEKINSYFSEEYESTIRMYSLQKSIQVFKKYPLLGTGIGTFGSSSSIKYNSYVYQEFDINKFNTLIIEQNGNIFESTIAKVIIETGLIGIAFHTVILYELFKEALSKKNDLMVYLLVAFIITSIIANSYKLPYLIGIGLISSKIMNNEKKQEE